MEAVEAQEAPELWRDLDFIPGGGNYQVSTHGRIRNLRRNKILKCAFRTDGYYHVCIGRKLYLVHRLVAMAFLPADPEKKFIDHKDGNRANNHIDNLRYCTQAENSRNRVRHKNNTSGFKGVSRVGRKYRACIHANRRRIHLGCFDTPEEAHAAYCNAAREVHGEFARFE